MRHRSHWEWRLFQRLLTGVSVCPPPQPKGSRAVRGTQHRLSGVLADPNCMDPVTGCVSTAATNVPEHRRPPSELLK